MLYAFLCYNDEATVCSWTKEQDDAVMARLDVVHQKLKAHGIDTSVYRKKLESSPVEQS